MEELASIFILVVPICSAI